MLLLSSPIDSLVNLRFNRNKMFNGEIALFAMLIFEFKSDFDKIANLDVEVFFDEFQCFRGKLGIFSAKEVVFQTIFCEHLYIVGVYCRHHLTLGYRLLTVYIKAGHIWTGSVACHQCSSGSPASLIRFSLPFQL